MPNLTPLPVPACPAGFDALSNAELADEITTWAGRVAAGEARLVALIGEFDRREAWGGVGLLSCAHWLSWRLGMGLAAAHERVRVARALRGLPLTRAAFGAGRLSWTQVRALTRVADATDEHTYVELARHATGAQLETLARAVRRARRPAEDAADPEAAAYRMRTRTRYDDDGSLVVTIRLPAEDGAVLLAALDQARDELDRQHVSAAEAATGREPSAEESAVDPGSAAGDEGGGEFSAEESADRDAEADADEPPGPPPATLTDAVLHLARAYLQHPNVAPQAARRGRGRLTAQVDPLSGWARLVDGELLPPIAVAAAGAALPSPLVLRRLTPADLTRADLGRTRRQPSTALRELLGVVDGERCRYPGCTRRRKLHAHHVIFWAAGGPTDLANLVLVCGRHHTLIHRDGYRLTLLPDRSLSVTAADGAAVPHRPDLPWRPAAELDPDQQITADTLPPHWAGDRLQLDYAVAVLLQHAA